MISNYENISLTLDLQCFGAFGFFLLLTIMAIVKGDEALNPMFKVYSNGLTKPLRSFELIFKSEGQFIPFSEIRAYEIDLLCIF